MARRKTPGSNKDGQHRRPSQTSSRSWLPTEKDRAAAGALKALRSTKLRGGQCETGRLSGGLCEAEQGRGIDLAGIPADGPKGEPGEEQAGHEEAQQNPEHAAPRPAPAAPAPAASACTTQSQHQPDRNGRPAGRRPGPGLTSKNQPPTAGRPASTPSQTARTTGPAAAL